MQEVYREAGYPKNEASDGQSIRLVISLTAVLQLKDGEEHVVAQAQYGCSQDSYGDQDQRPCLAKKRITEESFQRRNDLNCDDAKNGTYSDLYYNVDDQIG